MTDDDDDDPPPARLTFGEIDTADHAHAHTHPAGWLYLPDMSSRTGWITHEVPELEPGEGRRQPVGFRRA